MFIVETVEPENTLDKYKNSPKNLKKKNKLKGGETRSFTRLVILISSGPLVTK